MADQKKGLGGIAKRWLEAKKTELLTTNNRARENAAHEQELAERDMKEKAGEEVVLGLFPGLRKFKERQEQARTEAEERTLDEQRALPRAGVELHVDGEVTGSWSGDCAVKVRSGDGEASVELLVLPEEIPFVGSARFGGWHFLVPGYTGAGHYDLTAIAEALEADGGGLDYVDFGFIVGHEDDPYLWAPSVGAATVDVAGDLRTLTVAMAMTSSGGSISVRATLTLPAPLAA